MADFVPGLVLNEGFYRQVVGPLVARWPHAAARVGWGSDVIGFDTERSTDHGWGPQLLVLTPAEVVAEVAAAVDEGLPARFLGWPVRYGWDDIPSRHWVVVSTVDDWLQARLGVDPRTGLGALDWLCLPQQLLLEATSGAVYHDGPGALSEVRGLLSWYPPAVERWILAAQWRRVAQEEAFVGRTAEVGDGLGSSLVAGRLCRELMRLWFLLCRSYWPYSKWFGSAFDRLPGSAPVGDALRAASTASDHAAREEALCAAYRMVAERHNRAALTAPVDPGPRPYYGRPYRVLMADRFVEACLDTVDDEVLRRLPLVGAVDQMADSTDLLSSADRSRRMISFYRSMAGVAGSNA